MIQKIIFARDYGDNNGNDLTVQSTFATLQASFDSGANWQSMSKSGAGVYPTSDHFQVTSGINWSTANATGFTGDIWFRENASATVDKYKYKAYNYLTQPIDGITFIAKQNGSNIDLIVQSQADNVGQNNGQTQLNNANSDYASTVPSPVIQWYFNNQTPVVGSYSFVVNAGTPKVISFDRNLFPAAAVQTAAPVISTTVIDTTTTSISGTSVNNATVKVLADGAEITSVTANGSGAWTATIATQAAGKVITAKAIAGINTLSNASNSITVTAVVATQTAAPTISTATITTATTTVSGTGVASANVKIYADNVEIVSGASTVGSLGTYSCTIPTQAVGKVITTKQKANSENLSIASNAVTVTAIAAVQTAAPVITNSLITTVTTLITGTSEASANVTISADSTQIGTATASVSGTWSATIVAQTAGKVITAKAQAGTKTLSAASTALTVNNYLASSGGSNVTAETPDVEPTKSTDSMIIPLAVLSVALFVGAAAGFIKGNRKVGILLFFGFLIALSSLIFKKTN